MSKIRVLSDHLANQIAAGEVVERPASVAKELVENSIDAGASRVEIDVEAGGRRLLRVADDGCGMTRDDAVLAFERHATSKISRAEDLAAIATLGFRGEALASIASVARVELVTQAEGESEATRVQLDGGRLRDVGPAARPRGTTITMRDLFFNVPARRKFLRSEATESFHLTNLVTHYALAHPEIAFTLNNNGREILHAAPAADLRERAYQIFGGEFLDGLLEVGGGHDAVARVRGYVSAPRDRRTSRDAQYLFVNGRFVRDRLVSRALSEGYRSVLPHGVYPAALLFLEVPLEEVDVNVHPAKTEVRFRRAAAVADVVREAVRAGLASGGYIRPAESFDARGSSSPADTDEADNYNDSSSRANFAPDAATRNAYDAARDFDSDHAADLASLSVAGNPFASFARGDVEGATPEQTAIEFGYEPPRDDDMLRRDESERVHFADDTFADSSGVVSESAREALARGARSAAPDDEFASGEIVSRTVTDTEISTSPLAGAASSPGGVGVSGSPDRKSATLPPLNSAASGVREVTAEKLSSNIRPLGQLEESFIIATDDDGLLLIDQHVAHERILFDKYLKLESARRAESQHMLVPETFDLTPAQASAFDRIAAELESYGFELMRLSGRTVAVKAVPADLPPSEARNVLSEVLETIDAEKRGAARATLREEVAASLACHAAIKINMPLTQEKMRWLIDRLLMTSSPTTCPHGRPVILRLGLRDVKKLFHRI